MNNLEVIVCGSGLQDGLNPCVFMTCAAFIAQSLWLRSKSGRRASLRVVFLLFYVLNFVFLNFGPGQVYILRREFILGAKVLYLVLGTCSFIIGVLFLKDWLLSYRKLPGNGFIEDKIKPWIGNDVAAFAVTIALALVFSALATIGPLNSYIMLLGNDAFLKGHWQAVAPLLGSYVVTELWPLWFVWIFLNIKGLQASSVRMFYASIFLIASTCVIFIF